MKERKRWSVNVRAADEITGEAYNLLGPHGESSWFYASDGWDREEVELVVKRRNARLDAEEGERWRVSDLHGHCALGPQDQVVWFHMTGGAKRDPEACAAFVARENARLDAEEGRNATS